jgi:predicted CoA-binding protein
MASDDVLLRLLTDTRTWAVVGWSPRPDRPSHRVARFLHEHGKRVLPVNPTCVGADSGLDAPVVASLADITEPIDVVDVFRRSSQAGAVADEAAAVGAGAVWMQRGGVDEAAAERATAAGLDVVMDRCPAIEWPRLVG